MDTPSHTGLPMTPSTLAGQVAFAQTFPMWRVSHFTSGNIGVIGGLCLLVNGILGCCAASKKIPGLIISFLVFSVITLLPSMFILIFAFMDITQAEDPDPDRFPSESDD
jgi:hypothetical protein